MKDSHGKERRYFSLAFRQQSNDLTLLAFSKTFDASERSVREELNGDEWQSRTFLLEDGDIMAGKIFAWLRSLNVSEKEAADGVMQVGKAFQEW
jgi:hypothetical protein